MEFEKILDGMTRDQCEAMLIVLTGVFMDNSENDCDGTAEGMRLYTIESSIAQAIAELRAYAQDVWGVNMVVSRRHSPN